MGIFRYLFLWIVRHDGKYADAGRLLSAGLARFPQIHALTLLPIILGLVVGLMFLTIRGKINETVLPNGARSVRRSSSLLS